MSLGPGSRTDYETAQGHAHGHAHVHARETEYVEHHEPRHYDGKAIASFVLGLGGFLLPILPSILAVVFGHAARNDLRMDPKQRGDGLALTGLILGYVGLAVWFVFITAAVLFL